MMAGNPALIPICMSCALRGGLMTEVEPMTPEQESEVRAQGLDPAELMRAAEAAGLRIRREEEVQDGHVR
jgi:hypothetical protein